MSDSNLNDQQPNSQPDPAMNADSANQNVNLQPGTTSSAPTPASNDNNANGAKPKALAFVIASLKKLWELFIGAPRYIFDQTRLLLGNMASGSMLGLFFSLFLSAIITPIMFYAFNENFPDYDYYFKPKDSQTAIDPITIKTKTNSYSIVRNCVENEFPCYRYIILQEKDGDKILSGNDRELFSVVITDKKVDRVQLNELESDDNNNSSEKQKIRQLTIDVVKSPKAKDPNEVKWYETSNIAKSNIIFQVAPEYYVLKIASYPTSISAFVSWIKDYGKDELELKPSDDDIQKVASALERTLEDDWTFQNKTQLSLLFARSVNGSIQFLCVLLFNAILIMLLTRYLVILFFNPLHNIFKSENEEEDITTDQKVCESKMIDYIKVWGMESPMLAIWHSALKQESQGSRIILLSEITGRIKNCMETSFAYSLLMAATIPVLGFTGTVVGISKTMINISAIISNELGKQQSRITEVSLDLAFAFDTTLIALLLSMVVGFFITAEMQLEEKKIQDIAEDISNKNLTGNESNCKEKE